MVKLELFYSPVCPHCPQARKLLEKFLSEHPEHDYIEVNTYSDEGIKRGMSMQVMAVPTIAIDDKISIVGWPFEEKDLIENIEKAA